MRSFCGTCALHMAECCAKEAWAGVFHKCQTDAGSCVVCWCLMQVREAMSSPSQAVTTGVVPSCNAARSILIKPEIAMERQANQPGKECGFSTPPPCVPTPPFSEHQRRSSWAGGDHHAKMPSSTRGKRKWGVLACKCMGTPKLPIVRQRGGGRF